MAGLTPERVPGVPRPTWVGTRLRWCTEGVIQRRQDMRGEGRLTDLDHRDVPPCWASHGALLEELSAMHTAHRACIDPPAAP